MKYTNTLTTVRNCRSRTIHKTNFTMHSVLMFCRKLSWQLVSFRMRINIFISAYRFTSHRVAVLTCTS